MRMVMVRMLCVLIGLSMLIGPNLVAQEKASEAEVLLKSLRSKDVLRVDYEELVYLPFLKKPLKSNGQLIVHPQKGLIRKVLNPVASVAAFDGNKITVKDNSGTFSVDHTTAPQVVSAMLLWRTLVTDTQKLDHDYDVSVRNEDGLWFVILASREKNSIFKKCTIRGKGSVVLSLELEETDNVRRQLSFAEPTYSAELSAEEFILLESR